MGECVRMKRLMEMITGRVEFVLLGAALILCLIVVMSGPGEKAEYDTWSVEIQVVEKEITEIRDDELYLIHAKDRDGKAAVFEITAEAIGDQFTEQGVYNEIKTGKYYKLKISDPEVYDSYYPAICGAVKLIEGFSEEPEV